jgi:hypothetical protein
MTAVPREDARLTGPWRRPRQVLAEQTYAGHSSIHDDATAERLGFAAAPIEGPTHLSQIVPLAEQVWGTELYSSGCISVHFSSAAFEGEEVRASLAQTGATSGEVVVEKRDGTEVLRGTVTLGADTGPREVETRLSSTIPPARLRILDKLVTGPFGSPGEVVRMGWTEPKGDLYPFSLEDKLNVITEPQPWTTAEAGVSPWGAAVLPWELVSVLTQYSTPGLLPVREPSVALFLDLQVRMIDGPVLVGQEYGVQRRVIALGESRRTESHWTSTTLTRPGSSDPVAEVLLHTGVLKDSYLGGG